MPPSSLYPVELLACGSSLEGPSPALPLLAEPVSGEALPAWLHRAAQELKFSPQQLFLEDCGELPSDDTWWRHPRPEVLECLSKLTGVRVAILESMTFCTWKPHRSADEVMRRFARTRAYDQPLPCVATRHFGVCLSCLASDGPPRLRKDWTLGWVIACEGHEERLTITCKHCWAGFMIPQLKVATDRFDVRRCTRCFQPHTSNQTDPPHPLAMQLQSALLAGRDTDTFQWPGFPSLSWSTAVALIDVLLAISLQADPERRRLCFDEIEASLGLEQRLNGTAHDGMVLVAWLLADWPSRAQRLRHKLKGDTLKDHLIKRKNLSEAHRRALLQLL